MGGPESGNYLIQLAVEPNPYVGADPSPAPVQPIITDGSERVWTVNKLENGNYTLILQQAGRLGFIQDDGGNLVASIMPPPSEWAIRGQDGGTYTIEVPSMIIPTRAWTVNNPEPKSPVTLNILEIPRPSQQWNFIPVFEE